jgi:diguanylate cyclase (GGDEF)-like protein/PAS domain S-box-containing protein
MNNSRTKNISQIVIVAVAVLALGELFLFLLLEFRGNFSPFTTTFLHGVFLSSIIAALYFIFLSKKIIISIAEQEETSDRLRFMANVFESSNEAVIITDAKANIIDVNSTFCRITGYSKDEVIGQNPRIMKSDRHDREFYRDFWESLYETGQWQGEIWDRRKDGEIFPKWLTVTTIKDKKGKATNYIGIFSDITSIKQTEEQLQYYAHYDMLTRLPNRLLFRDRLKQAMYHAKRNKRMLAILFLDLDRFKNINDTLGHHTGDLLLQKVAERLVNAVRINDTVSRLGGDEFIVILNDIADVEQPARIAKKIIDVLAKPIRIMIHELFVTASVGITLFPPDGDSEDQLIKNADTAMYHAKEQGKNRFRFFTQEMNARATEQLRVETNLRLALEREEFVLYYQPRIDLQSDEIVGMEALIRRQEPQWLVPPGRFIPLAEETGLIIPIGEWTLRNACKQTRDWQEKGISDLRVSVNVSAAHFHEKNLLKLVSDMLEEADLDPRYLELEITERSIMEDIESNVKTLTELKEMGIHISLDDFGTGYSSLNYLRRLPIHTLKIDRSFIKDITVSSQGASVVKAIIDLGHSLNLRVLAEGAETEGEFIFLRENKCDELQGYYISVPLDIISFEKFTRRRKKVS